LRIRLQKEADMKTFTLTIVLTLLSVPAWSQEVTVTDVLGATINVTSTYREKIVRNGRTIPVELRTKGTIKIGQDKAVTSTFQSTATNLNNGRTRTGPEFTNTNALDKPSTGAADQVWTFADGSLVRLRVYTGDESEGGQKLTISFTRTSNGLACAYTMPMARENGTGRIRKRSVIDGAPIEILEFKLVGSACQVAKG
jgi:hypothetical protein